MKKSRRATLGQAAMKLADKFSNLGLNLLPRYKFEPLHSERHIRILTLFQTKGRIECSLDQIPVTSGSGYQALSYVWGSEERPYRAVVCSKAGKAIGYIPLTTNLYNALCDLRDAPLLTNKTFWIDQLSIDQEGEEKNHQVALMGTIYRRATRIITYVGTAAEDKTEERNGLELMRRLYRHFAPNFEIMFQNSDLWKSTSMSNELPVTDVPADLKQIQGDRYVKTGWRWVCRISYGSWTQRRWMVQEQLLNDNVIMLRGRELLEWDMVAVMSSLFYIHDSMRVIALRFWREELAASQVATDDTSFSVYDTWRLRQHMQRIGSINLNYESLLRNLAEFERLECNDPRDQIYSLLGISGDAKVLNIQPDYSASELDVFRSVSVRLLQKKPNLELLAFANRWINMERHPSHPSWALKPRISTVEIPDSLPFMVFNPHPLSSLPSQPSLHSKSTKLTLKGRILDTIAMSARPINMSFSLYHDAADRDSLQSLEGALAAYRKVLQYPDFGISLRNIELFCRTIMANLKDWEPDLHPTRQPAEQIAYHFLTYYRSYVVQARQFAAILEVNLEKRLQPHEILLQQIAKLISPQEDISLYPPNSSTKMEIETSRIVRDHQCLRGRALTVTTGGYACNAMHEVKEKDVIVALQGADRLYVLRPEREQYRLVGEAHVEGFMKGEAYKGVDPDDVDVVIDLI